MTERQLLFCNCIKLIVIPVADYFLQIFLFSTIRIKWYRKIFLNLFLAHCDRNRISFYRFAGNICLYLLSNSQNFHYNRIFQKLCFLRFTINTFFYAYVLSNWMKQENTCNRFFQKQLWLKLCRHGLYLKIFFCTFFNGSNFQKFISTKRNKALKPVFARLVEKKRQ